ncbi:MAG: NAD(P)-dependent oxidoreductase [Rhodospirillales bacterium]|nr:NAD(P)-dependent oxidoreductase [Rhodospirillales bacterium]
MSLSPQQEARAQEVAFTLNSHLPEAYRHDLLEEQRRIFDEVPSIGESINRTILIVGGAGYIGSVLTGHFLGKGYRVRSFDYLMFNNGLTVTPYLAHQDYEFMRGDFADEKDFARALDGVTDVVLLAGLVGDPITKTYPEEAAKINDDGHATMLRLLNGRSLNKVVFVSTCSNYGLIEGDQLADENFELNPLSLYAKSKVRVEKKLLSLKGKVDYTPTILRFATAFGLSPRMRFDLTVSEFTRDLFLGNDLLVFDAETWRPYCHLQDFAELIRRVLEAPLANVAFDVFNAGGEVNNFTKQMIVDAILEQLPNAKVRYQEHGADPRNYRVNFAKVRERLFFEPSHTVSDGIRELISAMNQGLFAEITQPSSFYGNWEIKYPA